MQFQGFDIHSIYEEGKFWITFIGVIITIYKYISPSYDAVKKAVTNDIPHIKASLEDQTKVLEKAQQTHTDIVKECLERQTSELKEMRNDLRMYALAMPKANAARRKNKK